MARIVEFEGRRIEVPDDATDAEVQQIIGGQSAEPAAAPALQTPQAPAATDTATYLAQRADRGLADALGAPVDLMSGVVNLGLTGADKIAGLFGGSVDARVEKPFLGSDWIADAASGAYEAAGGTVVPPEDMSDTTRMVGEGMRGTTAALVPAFGLASKAAQTSGRLAPLTKPYASSPGATLARDATAGAGAGVAAGGYDEYAPEWLQDSAMSPIAKSLAALLGGVGGVGLTSVVEGAGRGVFNAGRNMVQGAADPNAPINPATGKGFNRTEMDQAAQVAQQMPTERGQAIANIDDNLADFSQFARPREIPTTGMLADDIGMATQENVLRSRDPQRFAERDAARRSAASAKVDRTAPAGADGRNFTAEATRQYDDTLDTARRNVDDATGRQAAARTDLQRQNAELEAYRASQPQVSTAMAEDFNAARGAARSAKNAAYDAVDPATPVKGDFLARAVDEIDAKMPQAERMNPGPYAEIAGRVRKLATTLDADGNVVPRDITWGDLKALRAQVSEARKAAVGASGQSVAGSGADVQRLDELNRVLGHLADEVNPDAARFYREEYAPRFKEGRAGEYGAAVDRSARTGGESSATRPSEFGDKFLRKPEDAASLRRAMTPMDDASTPRVEGSGGSPAGPRASDVDRNAREWMLGDLAKSGVLTDNAEIRFDRFKQWADRNRATIDQFPDLADEVNRELARAQQGGALSKRLADEVVSAKNNLNRVQGDLRRSSLQAAIGNSPENAVASIMNSGDPERQMADLVGRLKGNKDATDGLKAATRDWIKDKAGVTSKIVGDPDATRLSRANLDKLFNRHEKTLASIYTPDEMNALRQAHKLMGAEAKLDVRATSGSNTFDKVMAAQKTDVEQRKRVLEAALKAKFGVLKGGGIFRTMNLFLQSLPDGNRGLEDLLFEMQFNPDLAKHLLTRPVKDVGSPAWNSRLNQLMAGATAGRESAEEPE